MTEGISPSSNTIHNAMGVLLSNIKGGDSEEGPLVSGHLGAPWFYWREGSRHLGYAIHDGNRTIQCPYIRYRVFGGILYKLGMEGARQPLFTHELYAHLQSLLEVPGVDSAKLNLFIKDILFNFGLEQALESLEDPGALAKVA